MKKSMIFMLIFILVLPGCSLVKTPSGSTGNTNGNIINLGKAAQDGDWIYFVNDQDKNSIYKIRSDDTGKTKLNSDDSAYINVTGGWVYYINTSDGSTVYKIRTDGTERTKLNNNKSSGLQVSGDWIYYSNDFYEHKLFRIKTDGSDQQKLNDDNTASINISGDWIFYYGINEKGNLYKIKKDGTERTKFLDFSPRIFIADGAWIYYINEAANDSIYKCKLDGTGSTRISDFGVQRINVNGDWIYYTNSDQANVPVIGRIKKDGSADSKISSGKYAANISIAGDWIYFTNVDGMGIDVTMTIYRVKTDGSSEYVAGLAPDGTPKPSPTRRTPMPSPTPYAIQESSDVAELKPVDDYIASNGANADGSIKAYVASDDEYYYLIYDNKGKKTVAYKIIKAKESKSRILYPVLNGSGDKLAFMVGGYTMDPQKFNGLISIYDAAVNTVEPTMINTAAEYHYCNYIWDDLGNDLIIKIGTYSNQNNNFTVAGIYRPKSGMKLNVFDPANESGIGFAELSPDKNTLIYSINDNNNKTTKLMVYDFRTGSKSSILYSDTTTKFFLAEPFYFIDNENLMMMYENNIVEVNIASTQKQTILERMAGFALSRDGKKIYYKRNTSDNYYVYEYDLADKTSVIAENIFSPYEVLYKAAQ